MPTKFAGLIPDALVIVFTISVVIAALTWVLPSGEFDRVEKNGRVVVVPATYKEVEPNRQGITDILMAPGKGINEAAHIIAFTLIVGGAFSVITRTGAIQAGIQAILKWSERVPGAKIFVLPLIIILFSLGGATFGMAEEVLVFILITIPLARSLGYDSITGVAIAFVAAGAGFAGAFYNPFTVGIAQGISDLPVFSGLNYRLLVWVVITGVTTIFIMRYAIKIEKDPTLSLMYERDKKLGDPHSYEKLDLDVKRILVLTIFGGGFVLLVFGVNKWQWYIDEISGLFLGMALLSAAIFRMSLQETVESFVNGSKDMLSAALIIGLSRGILVIASEGKIIDTILFTVSHAAQNLHPAVSVQMMFLVQSFLNFFVPSGSGQAALTIPIMAPLSDLLGITRQTAVLAYQFGDGFSNMIIPTSGITMGVLAIAKIPYDIWIRWIWKLFVMLTILAGMLLLPPVLLFHYGPF